MDVPIKLAFIFLTLTSTATATPAKRPDYLSTPHAKAIAGICTVIQSDTSLCTKTLKEVPSDDPIVLIRALPTAAESSVKKSVTFLIGIKPKHTSNAVATTAINSCEKNLNNALEDFAEFWKATGKDVTTMARNYFTCKKTLTSIMGYHSTFGKNLSSDSFDVFNGLHTIFKTFSINVKLNEEDTSPRPPPLSDYYY
ncbi:hypothetical protein Bca52824_007346 [Brassica carinata]|uniref:Pectinesterase inhibitor domain-containing protein n=1 Tax=Brassica carinata TaxID=52824 RepID=A0A8X7W642_BRACI|nr:hypothetical protein Bca52824_007346 [Brassica carinata]